MIKKEQLHKMVTEEVDKMLDAAKKDHDKIQKKLDEMRKKLFKEPVTELPESLGTPDRKIQEKRLQLDMVAEVTEVPVNELMLYFLNCIKHSNDRSLVEYRLGHVYFYNC